MEKVSSWRPKDWHNPFIYPLDSYKPQDSELGESAVTLAKLVPEAYENGADAMLKTIISEMEDFGAHHTLQIFIEKKLTIGD